MKTKARALGKPGAICPWQMPFQQMRYTASRLYARQSSVCGWSCRKLLSTWPNLLKNCIYCTKSSSGHCQGDLADVFLASSDVSILAMVSTCIVTWTRRTFWKSYGIQKVWDAFFCFFGECVVMWQTIQHTRSCLPQHTRLFDKRDQWCDCIISRPK